MKRRNNQNVLEVEQGLPQMKKTTNEIRYLPCPLNLQKPRLYLTNMRILHLINSCYNN